MIGSQALLVTIDIGTSGARAIAFDLEGRAIAEVRRTYRTRFPHDGWAEQDAREWRAGAIGALGDLVDRLTASGAGDSAGVSAIGLTGQCPSIVLVDPRGAPVSPGLIYRDNRAVEQANAIRSRFGDAVIHRLTGHTPSAFHIAPKLLWLRQHEPAAFRSAAKALQPRDLVALELTGELATDGSHASATLVYNLRARDWDLRLLDDLDLDVGLFPPVRESSVVIGGLRSHVAGRVGLVPGIPVVLGGADSQCCALGAGVVGSGPISEMAGSSTCLNAVVAVPLDVLAVTHYPHVVPCGYTTETGVNTSGAAVSWLVSLFYAGRTGRPTSEDYARFDAEAAVVPPGSDGVLVVPVLGDGERTDPDLRGAILQLSLRHGRAAIGRAMLEGITYSMRDQLELLQSAGVPITELRVSGGDARLSTWTRIKADVFGIPVVTMPGDATATGVAMLAGLGAGIYANLEEAIAQCVRVGPAVDPDPEAGSVYAETSGVYRRSARSSALRSRSKDQLQD